MESAILDAYNTYQDKLAELSQTIKAQVRAKSSLKGVQEALAITASMYYQRLRYPQNIPVQEVEALTHLVQNDAIRQRYHEASQLGQLLAESISQGLHQADISINFLCRKLNADPSTYYRKQKEPRLWSKEEIERIAKVIETIKAL